MRAHTWVEGNEFADLGAELGRRLHCTRLLWFWEGLSLKEEAFLFSLYDALWWTDQLGKPDPLTAGAQRGLGPCSHSVSYDRPA